MKITSGANDYILAFTWKCKVFTKVGGDSYGNFYHLNYNINVRTKLKVSLKVLYTHIVGKEIMTNLFKN